MISVVKKYYTKFVIKISIKSLECQEVNIKRKVFKRKKCLNCIINATVLDTVHGYSTI